MTDQSALTSTVLDTAANIQNASMYPPANFPGVKFVSLNTPQTWTSNGVALIPEGGSAAQIEPLNQVLVGTGTGVTSSPEFLFNPTTAQLTVTDLLLKAVLLLGGPSRLAQVSDDQSPPVAIRTVATPVASRTITDLDSAGVQMAQRNTNVATRTDDLDDATGTLYLRHTVQGTTRESQWFDPAGINWFSLLPFSSTLRFVRTSYPSGIQMFSLRADSLSNFCSLLDSAGQTFWLANTTVAGPRDFQVHGDNDIAMFYLDTLQSAGRQLQTFAEDATLVMDVRNAVTGRAFALKDQTSVAALTVRLEAALRGALFADHAAATMQLYNQLSASRTIQDLDEAGAQTLLVTLLAASKSYQFGASGAATRMNIDVLNKQLKMLATDGSTVTGRWDWASGGIGVQSTDQSASPGNTTINKPMGEFAIASGTATVTITNSTVAVGDIVDVFPIGNSSGTGGRDATGLAPTATTISAGSFIVTVSANCTGNLRCGFKVTKAL